MPTNKKIQQLINHIKWRERKRKFFASPLAETIFEDEFKKLFHLLSNYDDSLDIQQGGKLRTTYPSGSGAFISVMFNNSVYSFYQKQIIIRAEYSREYSGNFKSKIEIFDGNKSIGLVRFVYLYQSDTIEDVLCWKYENFLYSTEALANKVIDIFSEIPVQTDLMVEALEEYIKK